MFASFCLIVKYPRFLNQLSLNCVIVPGSGQTNDDVTSLMQICHNNNSNNNNYNSKANQYFLALSKLHRYIFTQLSVILRGHTFQMYTYRKIMRIYLVPVR